MNCADWEERIALSMGGDLTPAESAEVEQHLAECAGCQVFASGIRESLAVLREAHGEELDSGALAAVRARVLGELEQRRRPFWRHAWVYGLAAAAVLLAMVWMRPAAPHRRIEIAHHEGALPAPPAVERPPDFVPVRKVLHRKRRVKAPAEPRAMAASPGKPLVVKLVTDDPNVVIYWITDTRGE